MDKQTRVTWAERAVKAVTLAFPDPEDVTLWDHCERLLPHALVCASLIEAYSLEFAKASRLLNQTAYYHDTRAH